MSASVWLGLLVFILVLEFALEQWLDYLNARHFGDPVPEALRDVYDKKEYRKSMDYKQVNYRFSRLESWAGFILMLLLLVTGAFGKLDTWVRSVTDNPVAVSLLFFGILYAGSFLFSLPFDWYATFVIEEKFGFNKSTRKLFITDKIKSFLLTLVLGGIIGGTLIVLYYKTGPSFWLPAWIFITLVSLFFTMFYSDLIVPLFNKQTPLEPGELRNRLEALAQKAGFKLKDIYVIDSSKRSTRANAYFSGLGPRKRIVLYDTLIRDLRLEEIAAVLAHEIGHYKKRHILYQFIVSVIVTGISLFLLSLVLDSESAARALGAEKPSFHTGVLFFVLLYGPLSMLTSLLANVLSRKFEFQADSFAAGLGYADDLISGLKKLSRKSLSNLTPHPWYVFFHYSHPTLLQRIQHLKNEK